MFLFLGLALGWAGVRDGWPYDAHGRLTAGLGGVIHDIEKLGAVPDATDDVSPSSSLSHPRDFICLPTGRKQIEMWCHLPTHRLRQRSRCQVLPTAALPPSLSPPSLRPSGHNDEEWRHHEYDIQGACPQHICRAPCDYPRLPAPTMRAPIGVSRYELPTHRWSA